jgi:hypothetical protein
MMDIITTPIQTIDQEGKNGIGVMMTCAYVVDSVIDTFASCLKRHFICYDNCHGVGYVRQLGTEYIDIIKTDILEVTSEVVDLTMTYAEQEAEQ